MLAFEVALSQYGDIKLGNFLSKPAWVGSE